MDKVKAQWCDTMSNLCVPDSASLETQHPCDAYSAGVAGALEAAYSTEIKRAGNEQALAASYRRESELQAMLTERDALLSNIRALAFDNGAIVYSDAPGFIADIRDLLSAKPAKPVYWNKDSPGNATDVPTVEPRQLENLRHIRLHHWRLCEKHRRAGNDIAGRYTGNEDDSTALDFHRSLSEYHRKIVYALNDFFPAGDTADKDARNANI